MSEDSLLSELRLDPDQRDRVGQRAVWPWLIAGFSFLCIAAAVYFFLLREEIISVETALAEQMLVAENNITVLDATGYVTARRISTVSSKVTGKLIEVLIEEGDRVEKEQVLARLDDVDTKARLRVAGAQVNAARARLGELQAQLEQAQRDLKRQRNLIERKLTPQQSLDDAETRVTFLDAQIKAQEQQVNVAEAQLHVAEVNNNDMTIRAPFSGVVIAKAAQPGEMVSPVSAGGGFTRTGIGTIVDMDSLEIEVDVNESYINRVKSGQAVEAKLDAYPNWTIPAEVIAIIPTADRSKATVKVRIGMLEKDERIVPDMGARVSFLEERIVTEKLSQFTAVLIPSTAITEREGRSVVFLVKQGKASLRGVQAGGSNADKRVIESGLEIGDRVVVDPPENLQDGMPVQKKVD